MFKKALSIIPLVCVLMVSPALAVGAKINDKFKDSKLLEINKDDVVIGLDTAKIVMIEYSSLSCPHCAYYHNNVFNHIKAKYILGGDLKYVMRDFPINTAALTAAKVAHCAGKDRYMDFVDTFFEWQEMWAYTRDYIYPLEKISNLGGIDAKKFQACITDEEMEKFILGRALAANNNLEIDETPTFFINGEKYDGARDFKFYEQIIERHLKNLKTSKK